jgi:hypothetical protein
MIDCTLSGAVKSVGTYAEDKHLLASCVSPEDAAAWDKLVDRLIEWFSHYYEDIDEDGIEWPDRTVLARAGQLAYKMRDEHFQVASNVVPSGDGGVVFQWQEGPSYRKLEVNKDGSVEWFKFNRGTLLFHRQLLLAQT